MMKKFKFAITAFSIILTMLFCQKKDDPYKVPALIPAPEDNKLTQERIELGKNLYFDPRLSGSNWISCATCHNPGLGFSDALPKALGHGMKELGRNSPTIYNTAFQKSQFWDGRAATLEEQAAGPIQAPGEMNQNADDLVKELSAIDGYKQLFEKAYSKEGITLKTITKAIASYERTILARDSSFDRWKAGNKNAVGDSAKNGFALFEGKARCVICHSGYNFTNNNFHNLGLKESKPDEGRMAVTKQQMNFGAFKTPTLRNLTLTAPYMHNGMYKTLEEVIEHYDRGGDVKTNLDPNMKPLGLTQQEKKDLVEFMKSLTDVRPIQVTLPIFPQ